MIRPTWVSIVGNTGIVWGGICFLGAAQGAGYLVVGRLFPGSILPDMESAFEGGDPFPPLELLFELMQYVLELPQWYVVWTVGMTAVYLVVIGVYFYSATQLLTLKPKSIKAFSFAALVWIGLSVLDAFVGFGVSFPWGVFLAVCGATSVAVNIALIYVIHTSDKSCFLHPASAIVSQCGTG